MKFYPVSIVGEQHYRTPQNLRVGDEVFIVREADNPFDRQAVAVRTLDNFMLGYIPRDNFVYDVVNNQGRGIFARILSIDRLDASGHSQIKLSCAVVDNSDDDCIVDGSYTPASPQMRQQPKPGLLALIKRYLHL